MTVSSMHALRRRPRGGFTLIEVMLVLMILVIIASMAVVAIRPMRRKARIQAARTQIKVFETPLEAYEMDLGEFPSTNQGLEALLQAPSDLPNPDKWFGPYLRGNRVPKDPWGNAYQYEYPGKQNLEDMPDIWSMGPDSRDGTEDDVGNWMVEE